ncbi:MAG: potassium-transporting ATPase subunit KdpC [Candidatus Obscuribacter sp.]|nr:potassium-transporting ATPase subunit KdpC [Candidatus Obscuribacter sp.]
MINSLNSNSNITATNSSAVPKPNGSLFVQAGLMFLTMTALTGVLYPLAVTMVGQALCPQESQGSLIKAVGGERLIGSGLLGQNFTAPRYFWGRPSATTVPYDAAASSGSNLASSNQSFVDTLKKRTQDWRQSVGNVNIPVDLVTASSSGLDPDISPQAAYIQAERVARERHLDLTEVKSLISGHIQPRQFGLLGEPRVNVLKLNLALDSLTANANLPATDSPKPNAR